MSSASTSVRSPFKIIPIVPERRYKSLEYSIKRLIALRSRATFAEVTNFILQFKNRQTLGDFGIQPNKLNRRKLSQVLQCLCREKKVIRKSHYFEHPEPLRAKQGELVRQKVVAVLLVESQEEEGRTKEKASGPTDSPSQPPPVYPRPEPSAQPRAPRALSLLRSAAGSARR